MVLENLGLVENFLCSKEKSASCRIHILIQNELTLKRIVLRSHARIFVLRWRYYIYVPFTNECEQLCEGTYGERRQ